ncbi:hypothetical protein [Micromonospora sp. NPDC047074]|uniref:hypothetical protein n=1 Tax=Micromonospora sp. NPDC047074 TaxID=3154339 RepID=UPI0033DFF018
MSFRRPERPADRAASERLLDTARAGWPRTAGTGDPEPLARLLSAAAAPARPGELAGEEAAAAAFRAARVDGPAAAPARSPHRSRFTAGAVAWGTGIAVTTIAGAAFAAVALDRPADPAPPPRPATPVPATTATDRGGTTDDADDRPTGIPRDPSAVATSAAATRGATAGEVPGTPKPRTEHLPGLCRAYLAKPPGQRERALDAPGFAALVTAAGGAERVTQYCRELAPEPAPKKPAATD